MHNSILKCLNYFFHYVINIQIITNRIYFYFILLSGPYSCFFSVIGVYFDFIHSRDILLRPQLAVKRISGLSQVVEISPDLEKIKLGDLLVKVNGLTFREFYESVKWRSNGANEYGGMRTANSYMSYRSGLLNQLPESETMVFELYSKEKKAAYTVELPWVAIRDDICFKDSWELISNLTGRPMVFCLKYLFK